MGAIAPPPPWHTIFNFLSVIVTKKLNRDPLKINRTKSEDFLFLGVGWLLYQILDSSPHTLSSSQTVPNGTNIQF